MAIENIGNGEINIKNLAETKSKPEFSFDPERDVSSEDWEEMIEILRKYQQQKDWREIVILGGPMRVIFPNRVKELDLEKDKEWIKKQMDDNDFVFQNDFFYHFYKMAFPEENNQERLKRVIDRINQAERFSNDFFAYAFELKVISPQEFEKLNLEKYWEEFTSNSKTSGRIAMLKLLFPEKIKELDKLGAKFTEEAKENLEKALRSGSANNLMFSCFFFAKDIQVTEEGIKIIPPKKEESFKAEKMPKERRY